MRFRSLISILRRNKGKINETIYHKRILSVIPLIIISFVCLCLLTWYHPIRREVALHPPGTDYYRRAVAMRWQEELIGQPYLATQHFLAGWTVWGRFWNQLRQSVQLWRTDALPSGVLQLAVYRLDVLLSIPITVFVPFIDGVYPIMRAIVLWQRRACILGRASIWLVSIVGFKLNEEAELNDLISAIVYGTSYIDVYPPDPHNMLKTWTGLCSHAVRGIPNRQILLKHILKNWCILTLKTEWASQLTFERSSFECIYGWLTLYHRFNRDIRWSTYVLLIGVLFVGFNLLFDILRQFIRLVERSIGCRRFETATLNDWSGAYRGAHRILHVYRTEWSVCNGYLNNLPDSASSISTGTDNWDGVFLSREWFMNPSDCWGWQPDHAWNDYWALMGSAVVSGWDRGRGDHEPSM